MVTWYLLLFVGQQRIGKRSQAVASKDILAGRENFFRPILLKVGGKAPLLLEVKMLLVDQQVLSREDDSV